MKKDLVSIADLSKDEILELLKKAEFLKIILKEGRPYRPLVGKTLAMIFQKPSVRTRVSFEVAMLQLGGHVSVLSQSEVGFGERESTSDVAKVLSKFVDGIVARTFRHSDILDLARSASVPVINGLSDFSHPCQVLSDLFTIKEKGKSLTEIKISYIGDANNVANSWLYAAGKMGMNLTIASPKGYGPKDDILKNARQWGGKITVTTCPGIAAKYADCIYTDVWTSMGQEREREIRKKKFSKYQVNGKILSLAKKDVIVMHCLPAHRGEEITGDVLEGPNSVVYEQAENRLHMQKAILLFLMSKKEPVSNYRNAKIAS